VEARAGTATGTAPFAKVTRREGGIEREAIPPFAECDPTIEEGSPHRRDPPHNP
jgi:hypothetical protein